MERRKVLFIDRDGTIIKEKPPTYQIDSLKKLEFYPRVMTYLPKIARLKYELVMVTNQDGLGTDSFPEENFLPVQQHVLDCLGILGVKFEAIHIDRSFPHENKETRKPRTGMLLDYFNEEKYDLSNSYVIGDRLTDVELAKNMGCKAIWLNNDPFLAADEVKGGYKDFAEVIALKTKMWREVWEFLLGGDSRLRGATAANGRKNNSTI